MDPVSPIMPAGPHIGFLLFGTIWMVLAFIALTALVAGAVLLVRFLLIGTRAAQLYIDAHDPSRGPAPAPSAPPAPDGKSRP
jgi:hypothetical protein